MRMSSKNEKPFFAFSSFPSFTWLQRVALFHRVTLELVCRVLKQYSKFPGSISVDVGMKAEQIIIKLFLDYYKIINIFKYTAIYNI